MNLMFDVNDLRLRQWFACRQPERRPDADCNFHLGCEPCAIAYEAQKAPPPDGEFRGWHDTWSPEMLESVRSTEH